jgi:hypothetical protein
MPIELDGSKLKRGDSYRLNVTISEGTFATTDILQWQAKIKPTDVTPLIEKSSATGGVVRLSDTTAQVILTPSDTNSLEKNTLLVWEFQRRNASGTEVDTLILPSGETVGTLQIDTDLIRN